ncbi:hypothetical protein LI328DRAFT_159774 [Trichoderma asperelloides]|nr:hypothetical protein LI328DRAFT_159774 [Trichoderma asperelloides]
MAQLQLAVSLLPTWIPFFYTAELRSQSRRNGGRTARENRLIWTSKIGVYSGKQNRFRDHSARKKHTVLPLRLYDNNTY